MPNKQGIPTFLDHLRPKKIHAGTLRLRATFCLGGLSFLFFIVTVVTGILLLFHYEPGVQAYTSVAEISSVIPFGNLIRGLHYWAAQLMVISVSLHMVRVVWHHAYRPPKEKNWVIGVSLFILTLILDFSGYLLRGDQEGSAAGTVALSLLKVLPGGNYLVPIFFGMNSSAGSTITIYVWHALLLGSLALYLQLWHFWRIRRDGGVRPL